MSQIDVENVQKKHTTKVIFDKIEVDHITELLNSKTSFNQKIFNTIVPKNKFILYNTAYFTNGVIFNIPDDTQIKESIYINNIVNQKKSNSYLNCRYLFSFGKNVEATIIIKDTDLSPTFLNTVPLALGSPSTVKVISKSIPLWPFFLVSHTEI